MTRIVVLMDGTWNSASTNRPTHLVKLRDLLAHNGVSRGQVYKYFSGVGTNTERLGPCLTYFEKLAGGAFGTGLGYQIRDAYRYICEECKKTENPEIYLFGFSRGAFAARSVAGMIRKSGIVDDLSDASLNEAFRLYRTRGEKNHPDEPQIIASRQKLSPKYATSDKDQRVRGGVSKQITIKYMGVWDTVGSLGVPVAFSTSLAALWNWRHRFHDTELSRSVESARQALALDERWRAYKPTLWINLDGPDGLNNGDISDNRPYQQKWFIGHHGVIGGSRRIEPLSAIAFNWLLSGAPELLDNPDSIFSGEEEDPLYPYERPKPKFWAAWRDGPRYTRDLHPSVSVRLRDMDPKYRPGSLSRLH